MRFKCIVVTYNSSLVIPVFISSCASQVRGCDLVFVDNSSCDDTVSLVRSLSPESDCLVLPQNLGFARAVNYAASKFSADRIILLNPDSILADDCIKELTSVADGNPDAAVIGAVQQTSQGRIIGPCPNDLRFSDVDIIFGAGMLLQTALLPSYPCIFDPRFFMYFEDEDLCRSVRRHGRRVLLACRALITHEPGSSSFSSDPAFDLAIRRKQALEFHVSQLIFRWKHFRTTRFVLSLFLRPPFYWLKYFYLRSMGLGNPYVEYQKSIAYPLFWARLLSLRQSCSDHRGSAL